MIILRKIDTTTTSGITDHSELNELSYTDSGHTGFQPAGDYLTDTEFSTYSGTLQSQIDDKSDLGHIHDDRYYTEIEVDTISGSLQTNINNKSDTNHTHTENDITDLDKYTQSEVDDKWPTWSGTIDHNTILNTHNLSTDIDHNDLTNYSADEHRIINDVGDGATDLWSASKISSEINNASGTTNHSELNELDYTSSGHTGFQPAGDYVSTVDLSTTSGTLQSQINDKSDVNHLHDDRYYTESEVDTISGSLQTNIDDKPDTLIELTDTPASYANGLYLQSTADGTTWATASGGGGVENHSALNELDYASAGHTGFSPTSHSHTESDISDLDKYTQADVDTISGSLSSEIDSDISTHTGNTDAHHAESHNIVSHSDTTATGANLNELVGGGDTTLHDHDGISENTAARHAESHTITSHSDIVDATGSQIEELTGGSETSLHTHDDRYYTESEVDTISGSLSTEIDSDISTHSSSADHDDRYYTEAETDALTWVELDITDLDKYTQAEVDSLIASSSGTTNHSELNELDYASSGHTGFQPAGEYYTESEVDTISGSLQSNIDGKADTSHNHNLNDLSEKSYNSLTDTPTIPTDFYSQAEVDTISGSLSIEIDSDISTHSSSSDHDGRYYTESEVDALTWVESDITDLDKYTQAEVDALIASASGTTDHSALDNLDYASSGHTGFSPDTHLHDDRYYTETELNDGQLDNRYYTESEVDTISGSLSTEIDSDISTHTALSDAHHAESHTITSHSDIVDATGANLEELTGGGDTTLHDHDGISENTAARHTESHSVASHSDTSATGAELNELTDGSETSLHTHDDRYYTESEVDTISGSLQDSIDNITVSGGVNTFIDLNDTPAAYSGDENKHVYVESDGTGLNFRYISDDDNYTEIIYSNAFPTQIDVYTNSGKTHQISSTTITRTSGVVSQTTKSIYDINTGTSVVGTFTTTINRVNGRVVSTTSVRT